MSGPLISSRIALATAGSQNVECHRRIHPECIAIRIDRKLKSTDVIVVLCDLFILRNVPRHGRSDNGPEFATKALREWITAGGAKATFIRLGSPKANGYRESLNARLLNHELFHSLAEAHISFECGRQDYSTRRQHSRLYPTPCCGGLR